MTTQFVWSEELGRVIPAIDIEDHSGPGCPTGEDYRCAEFLDAAVRRRDPLVEMTKDEHGNLFVGLKGGA